MQRLVTAVASRLVIAVPYLWLLVFFLIPFVIVFKISLSQTAIAMPPYVPVLDLVRRPFRRCFDGLKELSVDNYIWLTEDALYFNAYLSSIDHRRHLDHPDADGRLSDRLRHGARADDAAADPADAGHPAVLDQLPDPRLRLDRHPEARGPAQPAAAGAATSSTSR